MMPVFRKELIDSVRDRRSLVSGLLYAVWGPVVMALALMALAHSRHADAPLVVAIVNPENAGSLVAFLREHSVTVTDSPGDAAAGIRARTFPVALAVDRDYAERFAALRPATVRLLHDTSWSASNTAARRVRALLEQYSRRTRETRLVLRGLSPEIASPVTTADQDLSTAAGRAAAALATLPIFLLVSAFVGGMNVASDTTAGERERGSLEALLVHPVSRLSIVAGKWGAAVMLCTATVTLTVLASQAILRHPRIQALDMPIGLTSGDAAAILLTLWPLALFVPALQVLLSLFARSFKEAQTQLSLLLFVPMVPGFLFAFGSWQAAPWMAWVPILGQHVLVTGILRGEPIAPVPAAGLTAVTLAATVIVLGATARLLNDEGVVCGLPA